jgi:hypothetical protein
MTWTGALDLQLRQRDALQKGTKINHFENKLHGFRTAAFLFVLLTTSGHSQTIAGGAAEAATNATAAAKTGA